MKLLILKDQHFNGVLYQAGEVYTPTAKGRLHLEAHEPRPPYSVDLELVGAPLDAEGKALLAEMTQMVSNRSPGHGGKSLDVIHAIAAGPGTAEERRKLALGYVNDAR